MCHETAQGIQLPLQHTQTVHQEVFSFWKVAQRGKEQLHQRHLLGYFPTQLSSGGKGAPMKHVGTSLLWDSRQPFQLQRAPEMRAGLCKTGTLLTHAPCRSTPLPTALVQAPRGSGQPREPSLLHGVKLLDGHRPRLGGSVPVLCVAAAWFGFSPCPYFNVHATNGAWMSRSPRGEADLGRDWASKPEALSSTIQPQVLPCGFGAGSSAGTSHRSYTEGSEDEQANLGPAGTRSSPVWKGKLQSQNRKGLRKTSILKISSHLSALFICWCDSVDMKRKGSCLLRKESGSTTDVYKPSMYARRRIDVHVYKHRSFAQEWRSTTRIGFGSWRLEDQILAVLFALSTVIEQTSFQRESGPHGLAPHGATSSYQAISAFEIKEFGYESPGFERKGIPDDL
ncbi:hypothetical protein Anapl_17029 [Anas platyrhynchos]|uniref:Uncharacterized protein n=1 Tax=Anas platyrhynchos TaxID=8839 RepID=R0JND3_ANAPL|nr:hypothetical protein Anapl_17029 [Anas platyrhynchos]